MDYFAPYREKRALLQSKPDDIKDILNIGAKKAKVIASQTHDKVRTHIGLGIANEL